jgi:hypothetical protein
MQRGLTKSQLQRSKDNAAEIGLYPPRGQTGNRHENRHHASMYDRGHPRAVEDERHQMTTPPRALMPQHLGGFPNGSGYMPTFGYPSTLGSSTGLTRAMGFHYGFPVFADSPYGGYAAMYPPPNNMYLPQDSCSASPVGLGIRGDGVRGDNVRGNSVRGDIFRGDNIHGNGLRRYNPTHSAYTQ